MHFQRSSFLAGALTGSLVLLLILNRSQRSDPAHLTLPAIDSMNSSQNVSRLTHRIQELESQYDTSLVSQLKQRIEELESQITSEPRRVQCVDCREAHANAKSCNAPLPIPMLDSRNDLGYLLESEKKKTGVEVGVQRGLFSSVVLAAWQGVEKYYLVDLWAHQQQYNDGANVNQQGQEQILAQARQNLRRWESKAVFIRKSSIAAAREFGDESLDFVYLDARHDYAAVLDDMNAWWPKVKHSGIFAGHDLEDASDVKRWYIDSEGRRAPNYTAPELGYRQRTKGVRAAVVEFAARVGRQAISTRRESTYGSWMMRK